MKEINRFLDDLNFDEIKINRKINKVNNELKQYIEGKILPEYELNDGGHNSEHVKYVLKRAFELADGYEINYDILYTCVCFHDVACHIDRDRHEVLSAERAYEDEYLNGFFSIMEMKTIRETIEDHRASLEYIPRNIYGKILSSADRKVEVKQYLIASISYGKKKNPEIAEILTKFDNILGIKINEENSGKQDIPKEILDLIDKRRIARENKEWNKSDELRDLINQKGYDIKDTKQGTEIKKR